MDNILKFFLLLRQILVIRIFLPLYTAFFCTPRVIFFLLLKKYKLAGKYIHVWGKGCLRFIGQSYAIEGFENLDPSKRYIIISNHSSIVDIPILSALLESPVCWVMKESLFKIPILHYLFALGIGIPIPRTNARKSQEILLKKIDILKARMNPNIIIYPEGTRSMDGEIHHFKRGFVQVMKYYEMDILPITLCGFYSFLPNNKFLSNPNTSLKVIIHPAQTFHDLKNTDDKEISVKMKDIINKPYYP